MSLFLFQNLKIVCAHGSRVSVRTWGLLEACHPHGRIFIWRFPCVIPIIRSSRNHPLTENN